MHSLVALPPSWAKSWPQRQEPRAARNKTLTDTNHVQEWPKKKCVKKKQEWSVKKSKLFEGRRRRTSFIDFSGMDVFLAIFSSALVRKCFPHASFLCQDKNEGPSGRTKLCWREIVSRASFKWFVSGPSPAVRQLTGRRVNTKHGKIAVSGWNKAGELKFSAQRYGSAGEYFNPSGLRSSLIFAAGYCCLSTSERVPL